MRAATCFAAACFVAKLFLASQGLPGLCDPLYHRYLC